MRWPWTRTDDRVYDEMPDRGILAVALADRLGWTVARVAASLRRMERKGRVKRVWLVIPGENPAWEWHPVKDLDDREVEGELFAVMLLMNPHGVTAAELATMAGYTDAVTGQALARLEDAHQIRGEHQGGEWVWLIVLPEDGDQ